MMSQSVKVVIRVGRAIRVGRGSPAKLAVYPTPIAIVTFGSLEWELINVVYNSI